MHKENHDLVTPVIAKLKEDIVNINNELVSADNDYETESSLKEKLLNNAKDLGNNNNTTTATNNTNTYFTLEKIKAEKLEKLADSKEAYAISEHDPTRISRY